MIWRWGQLHWPHPFDHADALGLLQRLAADEHRGPLVFEARAEAGTVRHLIGAEQLTLSAITSMLRRLVPGASVTPLGSPRAAIERAGRVRIRQRNLGLALDTTGAALRALLTALSSATGKGDVLTLQIVLGASVPPQVVPERPQDPNLTLFDLVTIGPRPAPATVRADLHSKLSQYRFRATIRVGVSSPSPVRRRLLVHGILAALRQLQTGSTRIDLLSDRPELVEDAKIPPRKPLRLTAEEALCVLAWPTGGRQLPGMPPAHPRLLAPPAAYRPVKDRMFALTSAPGEQRPVGIAMSDALRHSHITGPTGSGKSTVLLNLIAADIAANRSVVVIDPKGDLAHDVLTVIPECRAGDVVVLDPTQPDPVGLNPFAAAGNQAAVVADRITAVFRNLFPSAFGPRVSDAVHASLLTLVATDGATLADLPRLLTDQRYRRRLTGAISDPVLAGFWSQYEAQSSPQQAQTIGPILTRLRQFLLRPGIRNVLDQPTPRFDLHQLFSEPRILIVSVNKGLLGPEAASLLGSLVVSQLWQTILARAGLPQEKRTPASIYLDEAQMFVGHADDLAEALEQSRSLGVAWHLAHQHRGQMPPALLAGIATNTRNKIQFQADPADAVAITRHSELVPEDVIKLPPFHAYVDLLSGGTQTGFFSARTLPPPRIVSDPAAILAESRARYGLRQDQAQRNAEGEPTSNAPEPGSESSRPSLSKSPTNDSTLDDEPIGRRRKVSP